MTDINAWLEHSRKVQHRTFDDYPVRLQSTMQEFYKLEPEACAPYQKGLNIKNGHVIVDEIGEMDAPTFVNLACKWNRDNDLDTNSLKSLLHCISKWQKGELKDEQSEHERRRYLEGL